MKPSFVVAALALAGCRPSPPVEAPSASAPPATHDASRSIVAVAVDVAAAPVVDAAARWCPAQDIHYRYWGNRRPCVYPAEWVWNGQRCAVDGPWSPGTCRVCTGADCGRAFATEDACVRAHADCARDGVAAPPPTTPGARQ